jgi:hypothetical protein
MPQTQFGWSISAGVGPVIENNSFCQIKQKSPVLEKMHLMFTAYVKSFNTHGDGRGKNI